MTNTQTKEGKMPEEKRPLVEGPKPFSGMLAQLEGGALHEELTDKLRDLNAALSEYAAQRGSAKGKLTLTIDFSLEKGLIIAKGDVTVKTPKMTREPTIFWLTPGNNLSTENPKQLPLMPRRIPDPAPAHVDEDFQPARKV